MKKSATARGASEGRRRARTQAESILQVRMLAPMAVKQADGGALVYQALETNAVGESWSYKKAQLDDWENSGQSIAGILEQDMHRHLIDAEQQADAKKLCENAPWWPPGNKNCVVLMGSGHQKSTGLQPLRSSQDLMSMLGDKTGKVKVTVAFLAAPKPTAGKFTLHVDYDDQARVPDGQLSPSGADRLGRQGDPGEGGGEKEGLLEVGRRAAFNNSEKTHSKADENEKRVLVGHLWTALDTKHFLPPRFRGISMFEAMCKGKWVQMLSTAPQGTVDKLEGILHALRDYTNKGSLSSDQQEQERHAFFWDKLPQVPMGTDDSEQARQLREFEAFWPRDDEASWLAWDARAAVVWERKQTLDRGEDESQEKSLSQTELRHTETMGKMQDVSSAVQRVAASAELRNAKSAIFTRAGHPKQRFATIKPSETQTLLQFVRSESKVAQLVDGTIGEAVSDDDITVTVTMRDGTHLQVDQSNDPALDFFCTGSFPDSLKNSIAGPFGQGTG